MYTKEALDANEDLELYSIATGEFGLKLDKNKIDRAKTVELILAAQKTSQAAVAAAAEANKKKYRIVIGHQEGVENSTHVAVGVNGYAYQIPRETEVVVPEEVLEALNHTLMDIPMHENGHTVMKPVRRFPISVLGPA